MSSKNTPTTNEILQKQNDPNWRRSAGIALEAVFGGMSSASHADPSGHAANTAQMFEVPQQSQRPAPQGQPTLDPRLQQAADLYIERRVAQGVADAIGPAVEAAVARALAASKAGGDV